jgi:hypothetical protein
MFRGNRWCASEHREFGTTDSRDHVWDCQDPPTLAFYGLLLYQSVYLYIYIDFHHHQELD